MRQQHLGSLFFSVTLRYNQAEDTSIAVAKSFCFPTSSYNLSFHAGPCYYGKSLPCKGMRDATEHAASVKYFGSLGKQTSIAAEEELYS